MTSKRHQDDRRAYLAALCRTVPYHITEAVLGDPQASSVSEHAWDGTVLYVDLVGFTSMCETWAREGESGLSRLSDVLSSFFTLLLEKAIFPREGYVMQFGGDSVTVVFRDKEHALRAAAAALHARDLVSDIDRAHTDGGHGLKIRLGLASGEVLLPILGDETQKGVIVAGTAANRAVQLQDLAEPGTVVIDASTALALGDTAIGAPHAKDAFVLHSLTVAPEVKPIHELEGRIEKFTEQKIELLEPFVPPPLAARLKTMPDGWRIDGELRRCVCVFAEVRGLMLAKHNKEVRGLSRTLVRCFRRFGGIVTKADVAADGHRLMAVFGLHAPTENDAERALLATTEISGTFKTVADAHEIAVTLRTGVHVGQVYFGAIGSRYRHDVTVVGDAVNIAARLAGLAKPFQVLATSDVLEEVTTDFEMTELEPVRVKGKKEPLAVSVVHGAAGGRAHYVQRRTKQRYVAGREREERRLLDIVHNALAGQARVLGLVGEAGAGKSFILSSMVDHWLGGGGKGLIGRCRYATRNTPLAPVTPMFNSYLGLAADESPETRKAHVRAAMARLDLGEDGEWLRIFLETDPSEEVRRPDGEPLHEDDWERVLSAIQRFVEIRVAEEPLLYVLEDVHYADTLTLELSRRISSSLGRTSRYLFVVTFRPDARVDNLRPTLDQEVRLDPLGLRQASELVRHLLGASSIDEAAAAFLWQRSGGNPGHLTELVRFLRDRSLLQVRAGNVSAPAPGISLLQDAVPETLEKLALARIEQLGGLERRVLRAASAIGQSFPHEVLEQILGDEIQHDDVEAGMVGLVDEGVIQSDASRRPSYRFREDVTRAVTYSTIPEAERRETHRRIANTLERMTAADKTKSAVTIALHRERAGQLVEAADWFRRALRVTSLAGLDNETRYLIERWEAVVARMPAAVAPTAADRAKMAVKKLVAVARRGAPAETLEHGRRIVSGQWDDLDDQGRTVVDLWLGEALLSLAQPDAARVRLDRVYAAPVSDALRAEGARLIARACALAERYDDAREWLDKAAELADRDSSRAQRVELDRAAVLAATGSLDDARVIYARVRDEAQRRDHMRTASLASRGTAECDLLSGDLTEAAAGLASALVMARALQYRAEEAVGELRLGQCDLYGHRPELARPHLERAVSIARDVGHKLTEIEATVELGMAIALTEDLVEGTALVADGYRRALRANLRPAETRADLHLLHLALLREDHAEVRAQLARCEANRDHLGVPLLEDVWDALRTRALSALAA